MADSPLCPNPACRRPMTFLGETKDSFCFGCYICTASRIITKPQQREAAAHMAALQRQSQQQAEQAANPNRRYSFGGKR